MGRYSIIKKINAEKDQTNYALETPLEIQGVADVFINGEIQEDTQYSFDTDTKIISLNYSFLGGEEISVRYSLLNDQKVEPVSFGSHDKTIALYKRYGTEQRLKLNNRYTISLYIRKEMLEFNFTTILSPLFSSVKAIREDIGEFIEDYTDTYIISKIHEMSYECIDLIDALAEDGTTAVTYTKNADGTYTAGSKTITQWVTYKTQIELILAKYYGISARYGSYSKQLGDLKIESSNKLPYIDQILKRLESKFNGADSIIKANYGIKAFVKAANTGYSGRTGWF